jgi:hypothetical protein
VGVAGGILIGIYSGVCQLLSWHVGLFSLTAPIQNKKDKIIWACTTMYGPTDSHLKPTFWAELKDFGNNWSGTWLIGWYFNSIRSRNEKKRCFFYFAEYRSF